MYTCVYVGAHPCAHVGVRGHTVDVALVAPGTLLFESESLIDLDISKEVRLAGCPENSRDPLSFASPKLQLQA